LLRPLFFAGQGFSALNPHPPFLIRPPTLAHSPVFIGNLCPLGRRPSEGSPQSSPLTLLLLFLSPLALNALLGISYSSPAAWPVLTCLASETHRPPVSLLFCHSLCTLWNSAASFDERAPLFRLSPFRVLGTLLLTIIFTVGMSGRRPGPPLYTCLLQPQPPQSPTHLPVRPRCYRFSWAPSFFFSGFLRYTQTLTLVLLPAPTIHAFLPNRICLHFRVPFSTRFFLTTIFSR